jgi:hypothetical protein
MGQPLPMDLRERIMAAIDEGMSRRALAISSRVTKRRAPSGKALPLSTT